jgi:hypothetical protein
LSLHLKIIDAMKNFGRESGERIVVMQEQLIARAPRFAAAHGRLALQLANSGPGDVRARLARAHHEAETALALYPATGVTYDALFVLAQIEAPTDLVLADGVLQRGLSNVPNFAVLHMRRCDFLLGVGRIGDAIAFCRTGAALRPLAPPPVFRVVRALWFAGDQEARLWRSNAPPRIIPTTGG